MFEKSKNVKRIVSLSAAAVCMLASFKLSPFKVIETDAEGSTVLTAFEITEEMKIGWNLGNTMDAKASAEDEEGRDSPRLLRRSSMPSRLRASTQSVSLQHGSSTLTRTTISILSGSPVFTRQLTTATRTVCTSSSTYITRTGSTVRISSPLMMRSSQDS